MIDKHIDTIADACGKVDVNDQDSVEKFIELVDEQLSCMCEKLYG